MKYRPENGFLSEIHGPRLTEKSPFLIKLETEQAIRRMIDEPDAKPFSARIIRFATKKRLTE